MRLLLDELYAEQIAEKLRERGHDVVSAKSPPTSKAWRTTSSSA